MYCDLENKKLGAAILKYKVIKMYRLLTANMNLLLEHMKGFTFLRISAPKNCGFTNFTIYCHLV